MDHRVAAPAQAGVLGHIGQVTPAAGAFGVVRNIDVQSYADTFFMKQQMFIENRIGGNANLTKV